MIKGSEITVGSEILVYKTVGRYYPAHVESTIKVLEIGEPDENGRRVATVMGQGSFDFRPNIRYFYVDENYKTLAEYQNKIWCDGDPTFPGYGVSK